MCICHKNLNTLILQEEDEEEEEEEEEIQQPPRKQTGFKEEHETYKPVKVDTNIGKEADKQLLRDFINGDYCIHGVRYLFTMLHCSVKKFYYTFIQYSFVTVHSVKIWI